MNLVPYILADGIEPEGFLLLGCAFLVPAFLVVLIEAAVYRWVCRTTFARSFKASFIANLLSALAGIPMMLVFAVAAPLVPQELDRFFSGMLVLNLIRYAGYYLLSVGVEFVVAARYFAGTERVPPTRTLWRAVLIGNAATYLMLCPIHYFLTAPRHTLNELHADTAWCADDRSTILYIDPATTFLMRTDPRHARTQTVVSQPMTDYQITPDFKTCLFFNDDRLYIWRGEKSTEVGTVTTSQWGFPKMSQVAMSPSGNLVAYTIPVQKKRQDGEGFTQGYSLVVVDVQRGRKRMLSSSLQTMQEAPALIWTQGEDVLLARASGNETILQLTITGSDAVQENFWTGTLAPHEVFGTFGTWHGSSSPLREFAAEDDVPGSLNAAVFNMLFRSFVYISRNGPWPEARDRGEIIIETNPGISGMGSRRRFGDIGILKDSTQCVLEDADFSELYVIDAESRQLGRLVAGKRMVLLTEKYQAAKFLRAAGQNP